MAALQTIILIKHVSVRLTDLDVSGARDCIDHCIRAICRYKCARVNGLSNALLNVVCIIRPVRVHITK